MLGDIRPLMTDQVRHWLASAHSLFGETLDAGCTQHAARVIYLDGKVVLSTTHQDAINARAVVWLLNHPRAITVGDKFGLPNGETLAVARAELRKDAGDALSKVYLT
ncbi:MAG: hypothetical protein EOO81_05135 [Oxalobacteraceae bacterium]|nr:MAG: hypothetical protein EOO81_05135 [Oxalobacteraceae bacterium]